MSWCSDILLGAHLVKIIGSCESQKVRDNLIDTTKKKWTKNDLFLFVGMLLQKPETSTLSVIKPWEIPEDFLVKNKEKKPV